MRKFSYGIVFTVGFFIRQFLLPNPFAQLGIYGSIINMIMSVFIGCISYFIVGRLYDKYSAPVIGSILYTFVYAVLVIELWLAFLFYPQKILIGIALGVTACVDGLVIKIIRRFFDVR